MRILIGHTGMDLDCFGSIALAKYLYPDIQPVQSHLIHPSAKNLFNLYQYRFGFITAKELKDKSIEHIVIVDTRSAKRVDEYFKHINGFKGAIDIYDHHPPSDDDILNANLHSADYGANSSLLALELKKRDTKIEPEDATIALTGIFADTGNFQHENVTKEDLVAASYLMENGASLKLVRTFLRTLTERAQIELFHTMLNRLTYKNINGHQLILGYLELDEKVGGLSAIAEKIFEVENTEALFCVFYFKKSNDALIVARSAKDNIRLDQILAEFGGGGHIRASSASVKDTSGMMVFARLEEHLKKVLQPAFMAEDIMEKNVNVVKDTMNVMEASMLLEEINHTGAPVITAKGELIGFITLRDIMKARKGNQMKSSVKGYMTNSVITGTKDLTIREIETIMFQNNIGHLPIVQGKSLLGIITRTDYLRFVEKKQNSAQPQN